jgi:hypothetical protein
LFGKRHLHLLPQHGQDLESGICTVAVVLWCTWESVSQNKVFLKEMLYTMPALIMYWSEGRANPVCVQGCCANLAGLHLLGHDIKAFYDMWVVLTVQRGGHGNHGWHVCLIPAIVQPTTVRICHWACDWIYGAQLALCIAGGDRRAGRARSSPHLSFNPSGLHLGSAPEGPCVHPRMSVHAYVVLCTMFCMLVLRTRPVCGADTPSKAGQTITPCCADVLPGVLHQTAGLNPRLTRFAVTM